MKIAIIGAMKPEITLLRNKIDNCQPRSLQGFEIYTGQLNGVEVALLQSGIGKVSAAISTSLLLNHYQPNYVINTGSAGGLASNLKIGDIVVSKEVCYHDVDVTAFDHKLGQIPGCPATFTADNRLITSAEKGIEQLALPARSGLICSGDAFINGAEPLERLKKHFPAAIAVDMEATAIGHVCHQFNIPFVIVRAISDVACQKSHLSFDEFLPVAAQQSSRLVASMLSDLAQQSPAAA